MQNLKPGGGQRGEGRRGTTELKGGSGQGGAFLVFVFLGGGRARRHLDVCTTPRHHPAMPRHLCCGGTAEPEDDALERAVPWEWRIAEN